VDISVENDKDGDTPNIRGYVFKSSGIISKH